jgi:DNA-binding MarR family transcriptional regulator
VSYIEPGHIAMDQDLQLADDSRQVANDILRKLRSLLRKITLHSKHLGKQSGLTLPQLVCMQAIRDSRAGEATAAEIATRVELSPPTVTGIIDRLMRAGLIAKERGTSDRRKVFITLTDEGHRRLDSVPQPLQVRFVQRIMAVDPEERRTILTSLERLVELMGAEDFEAGPLLYADEEIK